MPDDPSPRAGELFDRTVSVTTEDAQIGRLRYHLLRLQLPRPEINELLQLARAAFADGDVREQATAIRDRDGVDPVTAHLADVVGAADGRGNLRAVFLGAVHGAHLWVSGLDGVERSSAAALGAAAGAAAAWTGGFVTEHGFTDDLDDYLEPLED